MISKHNSSLNLKKEEEDDGPHELRAGAALLAGRGQEVQDGGLTVVKCV